MKRTEIMAHAMHNLGSPVSYKDMLGHFYTDELSEYFSEKQLPIIVRDYSGDFFYTFKTFKELEDNMPNTKLYPDDALYQSDGLHFRLSEYHDESF